MASLGSLCLLIQTSTSSCSAPRQRRTSCCWERRHFFAIYGRRSLDPNGVFCKLGIFGGLKSEILKRGLRATGKREGIGAEEENGGDDEENVADESFQATLKQSKEVLARQKNLIRQIEERRKLVSSITSNAVNIEIDAATNESGSYSQNTKQCSTTTGELDKKYSITTAPEKSDQLSKVEVSVRPPSSDKKSVYRREIEDESPDEHSVADALGLSREVGSEAAHSAITSPSLSRASELYVTENLEDLIEQNIGNANAEQDATPGEGIKDSPPLAGANVMNVILVAAECAPWSKTGGLGDVAGALPKALAKRGHRVMVVVPRYGDYSEPQDLGVRKRYKVDGQDMEVSYFHAYIDGVDFVFIDSPIFRHREKDIYGGNRVDILKRMVLFCKAAVEVPWYAPCGGVCYGDGNLVFIANDWHTALLPVYLKAYYRDNGLMKYTRCVLVIHNIAHQGRGPIEDFHIADLPGHYIDLFKLYDPMGGEHFNIFAAGLKAADRVVTVSHGYAWELKTQEGGWGLHGIINENDWKFKGIVNGVDTKDWNPSLDVHLKSDGYANYSLETLHTGKSQCKAALQKELGLPVRDHVPIIGFIGRLDYQKGVDLIAEAMPWIVGQDVQLIMLGTGRQDLEEMLRNFEGHNRDKVRGWVGFSVKMAHRITAGADVLLMPSRFEPCGLNQLYAMMYGTVPVVHAVGGLRDTVQQFDPYSESGLGWTFDRAESHKLIDALGNCLNTYWNYKKSWEGLQRRGMMQDLSWDSAAQQYEEVLVAAKYQW
ncbi:uncharacterized protein A4U43_C03F16860 [Asparagus officinalis]|uniref:starch synthase n=1 Tax=Asparagus officinalis TaxID=4686 RepID=A0A5P1FFV1_ASPOF|nr:soluble starch synthase 2-2, chloroplastic/amyloplastic [Asparagus officinalis]ONK75440.1 uncharacterized protein A4U43_C03F16860 [Asparagus officinalis]